MYFLAMLYLYISDLINVQFTQLVYNDSFREYTSIVIGMIPVVILLYYLSKLENHIYDIYLTPYLVRNRYHPLSVNFIETIYFILIRVIYLSIFMLIGIGITKYINSLWDLYLPIPCVNCHRHYHFEGYSHYKRKMI